MIAAASSSADLVQAASLLVAGLAVVYGLWYPDLRAAEKTELAGHPADQVARKLEIGSVYRRRALPLLAGSVLTTATFAYPALDLLASAIRRLWEERLHALGDYDAVEMSLVLVTAASAVLSWHVWRIAATLRGISRD
jgi:hypothetical protein